VHEDLPVLRREHSGKRSKVPLLWGVAGRERRARSVIAAKARLDRRRQPHAGASTRTQTAALTILVGCAVSIGSLLLPWTVGLGGIFPVPAATGFDALSDEIAGFEVFWLPVLATLSVEQRASNQSPILGSRASCQVC
jgi:hypothetical protein